MHPLMDHVTTLSGKAVIFLNLNMKKKKGFKKVKELAPNYLAGKQEAGMLQAKLIPFSIAEVNQMERSVPRIYLCMQAYSLLCYLAKGTRRLVIEAITYMRLSNFYGDDGSYLPLLPNSSERLGIAGGQGGRYFRRQLSSRCAMTTLTAAWADAGSCQAPTASIHVAEKKSLFFPMQTFLLVQWAPGLSQWGWVLEDSRRELCTQRVPVQGLITNGVNQTCSGVSQSVLTL